MLEKLVVVIPTAGRAQLLRRTLESLADCTMPGCYCETIVVENGPRADARSVVSSFQDKLRTRYLHVEKANKSNALNVAIAELDDRCLVYFTDDDVRLSTNVLATYAEAAREMDGGVFLGGATGVDYDEPPPEWLRPFLPSDARPFTRQDFEKGSRYLVFLGFNWAAFVGDIRAAGGFDSRFGPGGTSGSIGQESDMQQRLLGAGVEPQFVAQAKVWHYVPLQRCSPQWIANRHYRFGILDAITRRQRPQNRLRLPVWHWRRVARQGFHYLITRVHPNIATRFDAKLKLYCEMGMARGAWLLARKQNSDSA